VCLLAGRSLTLWVTTLALAGQAIDSSATLGALDLSYKLHFWDGLTLPCKHNLCIYNKHRNYSKHSNLGLQLHADCRTSAEHAVSVCAHRSASTCVHAALVHLCSAQRGIHQLQRPCKQRSKRLRMRCSYRQHLLRLSCSVHLAAIPVHLDVVSADSVV
jgi:hypothetical protein